MGKHPRERQPKPTLWSAAKVWAGGISAFIIGVSAVAAALVALGANFPRLLPFLAPFDASISLRDPHDIHVKLADVKLAGQPAVEISLQYVLDKNGPSTLRDCHLQFMLQETYHSVSDRPQTITDIKQENQSDTFQVKADQYSKNASLMMTCEKRVSNVLVFSLPEFSGLKKPTASTFYLCIGEHREACGSTANWAPCGGDVSSWARSTHPSECGTVSSRKLSDVGGNQCGYATFQVTCTSP